MIILTDRVRQWPYPIRLGLAVFGMARPQQLVAVTLVYLLGTVIAIASGYSFEKDTFWWGYAALIPISMSIHYANEYADYETDALTQRTPFSGGSGALHYTGLDRHLALRAAQTSLALGLSIYFLCLITGRCSLIEGGVLAFGAFFGWMYSLPPLQLAWYGWGELDNAMLGGVALPTYGYVAQSGYLNADIILMMLPFGLLVFINLLATTWADREADAHVGKFTLATRWSAHRLRWLYGAAGSAVFILLITLSGSVMPRDVAIGSMVVIPMVVWGLLAYTRFRNPFPTVAAMIVLLVVQLLIWAELAADALPIL